MDAPFPGGLVKVGELQHPARIPKRPQPRDSKPPALISVSRLAIGDEDATNIMLYAYDIFSGRHPLARASAGLSTQAFTQNQPAGRRLRHFARQWEVLHRPSTPRLAGDTLLIPLCAVRTTCHFTER